MVSSVLKIVGESLTFFFWWKKKKVEDSENPSKQLDARQQEIDKAIIQGDEKSLNTRTADMLAQLRK